MASRSFRTEQSTEAEKVTRDAIGPFLAQHGFDVIADERKAHGTAITQVIVARRGGEKPIRIHVRLCWRRGGRHARENLYSAAQLRARLINNGDWEGTLAAIAAREAADRNSHLLMVQDSDAGFVLAALIPCDQIPAIWERQRDVSAELIATGRTGKMRKNHAANGSSPTIWLQDDRTPDAHLVSDVLWAWPGVVNVMSIPSGSAAHTEDDSWDDLGVDDNLLGRDFGSKRDSVRSGYPRDRMVRAAVRDRANGQCERKSCNTKRAYPGFLDVHHILGIGMSDRVWSCVALCPNCHREAHFAPDRDEINAALGIYACQFKVASRAAA